MNDPSPTSTLDDRRRRRLLRAAGLGVALAALALMLATEPRLAIAWDEGYTLGRENRIRLWFRALRDPAAFARGWVPPDLREELVQQDRWPAPRADRIDTRAKLFDRPVLAWFWPFARAEPHGHPPFYAIVGLIGDLVVPGWADLPRARFGPILVFSLTAGCLFTFVGRRWGAWAGAATAGAWVLQPQLFGHAHYAAYDGLLTCLWVDAILAFWMAIEPGDDGAPRRRPRWGWAIALGLILGWAADTKLTGWFLALPFLGWVGLYASSLATPLPAPPPRAGGSKGGDPRSSPSPLEGEGRVGGGRGMTSRPGRHEDAGRAQSSAPATPHPHPPPQGGGGPETPSRLDSGVEAAFRRTTALTACVAAPIALLTLYLFNPAWWIDPIGGVERFLRANLTRGNTIPIPIRFLGTTYNTPIESLPWYNTLAWTVMATPVGFLALAIVGGCRAVARRATEPFGLLVLGHWAFLIFLRALPHTPGHDGVRLFLPAFGVLAILAGLGAATAVERWGRWGRALVVAAIVEGAASVAVMMPVPLSYYSPIVGGLPGATRLGMEPTYYWDALTDDALEFLNTRTPPGYRARFASFPLSFFYLRKMGRLTAAMPQVQPGADAWYVLQNRPGVLRPEDRALIAKGGAAFVVSKLGVPLLWVFPLQPQPPR